MQSANLLKVLLAEPTQAAQHQIISRKSFIRAEIPAGHAAPSWQAAALPHFPTALKAALGGEAGAGGTTKRQLCVLSPAQGLIKVKLTKTVHSLWAVKQPQKPRSLTINGSLLSYRLPVFTTQKVGEGSSGWNSEKMLQMKYHATSTTNTPSSSKRGITE